jgi:hypothetical protein
MAMIRVICPSCQSRLNAKEALAGQKRNCPKCGTPVEIPVASEEPIEAVQPDEMDTDTLTGDEGSGSRLVHDLHEEGLPRVKTIERLVRSHFYLVCDRIRIFATWQDDGQGWMLKTSAGPLSAKRNADQIPAHGDFMIVELILKESEEGRNLTGISVYEIPKRWALPALARGDEAILRKLVGPGRLTREQKLAVRKQIESQFMPDVWAESREVLDYLSNDDFHSPGTE